MEPHILSYIPQGKSVDMNELIGGICAKEKISVFPISSGWFDIGQWEEYSKTLKLLSDSDHV
jgi:NDP-sugar pyrophosphorylase family protein